MLNDLTFCELKEKETVNVVDGPFTENHAATCYRIIKSQRGKQSEITRIRLRRDAQRIVNVRQ